MTSACYPKHPEPTSGGAECAISMLADTELAGLLGIYTLKVYQRPRNLATSILCPLYSNLADSALLFRSNTEPAKSCAMAQIRQRWRRLRDHSNRSSGNSESFFRTRGSLVERCSWAP